MRTARCADAGAGRHGRLPIRAARSASRLAVPTGAAAVARGAERTRLRSRRGPQRGAVWRALAPWAIGATAALLYLLAASSALAGGGELKRSLAGLGVEAADLREAERDLARAAVAQGAQHTAWQTRNARWRAVAIGPWVATRWGASSCRLVSLTVRFQDSQPDRRELAGTVCLANAETAGQHILAAGPP